MYDAGYRCAGTEISTHSRAKAAGARVGRRWAVWRYFNSQPREGGWGAYRAAYNAERIFQLTAARRRLGALPAKAAPTHHFNSQPREGGWSPKAPRIIARLKFQLTAARRRLVQKESITEKC